VARAESHVTTIANSTPGVDSLRLLVNGQTFDVTDVQSGGKRTLDASAGVCPRPISQVEDELLKGAAANGYPTDVWTLQRVAEVIERLTGVRYHPAHVWSLLRQDLKWSWQRPARRATERNEDAIHQWVKKRWPYLKKGRSASTH
jgi:transposase